MKLLLQIAVTELVDLKNAVIKIKDVVRPQSIILLSGKLSAGKTTFVSYFAQSFGIQVVQSPTYAIHQRYQGTNVTIDHYDLYRLNTSEEIDSAGFYDLLSNQADYKFIEWPQRISNENLPLGVKIYLIEIEFNEQNVRMFKLFIKN